MTNGLMKMLDVAGQVIEGLEQENARLNAEVQRLSAAQPQSDPT